MAHVIQLILGAFMKELRIKIKDEKMPAGFKDTYINKVMGLEKGFGKTVEKVSTLRSIIHTPANTYAGQ